MYFKYLATNIAKKKEKGIQQFDRSSTLKH